MFTAKFAAALQYATQLHDGQTRKGPEAIPYVSHLLAVASLVLEQGGSETEAIAALLHDAIEDQPREGATKLEIRDRFGPDVLRIVVACTDGEEGGERSARTWRSRKERYLAHVREMRTDERLVSLADKVHNARSILADLRKLNRSGVGDNGAAGARYWDRFNVGKEQTLWYYRRLVQAYSTEGHGVLEEELARSVTEIERLAEA